MKALRAPLGFVVAWAVIDVGFTVLAGHEGLLAPFGPVRVETLLGGALALGVRLVGTFVALPWLTWRLTRRA